MNQDSLNALRIAADLIKTGDTKAARPLIIQVLRDEPNNTQAWYMLSFAVPRQDKQIHALQQLLQIDPNHEKALNRLKKLGGEVPSPLANNDKNLDHAGQEGTHPGPKPQKPTTSTQNGEDLLSQRLFGEQIPQKEEKEESELDKSAEVIPQNSFIEESEPETVEDEPHESKEKPAKKRFFGLHKRTFILILAAVIFIGLVSVFFSALNGFSGLLSLSASDTNLQTTNTFMAGNGSTATPEQPTATPNRSTPTPIPQTPTPQPFTFNTSGLFPPNEESQAMMLGIQDQISAIMGLTTDYPIDSYSISQTQLESYVRDFDKLPGMKANAAQVQFVMTALGLAQSTEDYNTFYSNLWVDPNGTLYLPDEELIAVTGFGFGPYQYFSYAQAYAQHIRNSQLPFEDQGIFPPCNYLDQSCEATTAFTKGEAGVIAMAWAEENLTAEDINKIEDSTQKIFFVYPVPSPSSLMEAIRSFPYIQGYSFANAIYQSGGIEALNDLYQSPPTTTEQILHPDKYLQAEPAASIDYTDLAGIVPSDFRESFSGSLGEWKTYLLLAYGTSIETRLMSDDAALAAAGWGGDHLQIYTNDESKNIMVGHWTFDTPTDTQEFLEAMEHYAFNLVSGASTELSDIQCNRSDTGTTCVAIKGNDVVWLFGPNQEIIENLITSYSFLTTN